MNFFKKIRLFATCFLPSAICLLSSCSQKKNTFTSRTYHNLTAHYNGLYWANVSLDEGIFNLEKAHKDDYSKILPVFKYADDKAAKANYPQFDKAIEKINKVIQYHSMLIKGKEHNRWIDENYMTLGKAHFYKRDYYAAVTVFEYVVKIFSENPVKYDAFLWLVRSYNQMNSVIKTGPILDLLKHDKNLPKRLRDDYQSVLSDYYVRTEQYKKAEEALAKAVELTKKKTIRGRYLYILAQLYEDEGDLKKATDYYSGAAKLHPSYEIEFNARLAKARTFQVDKGADTKELKRELQRMLKDEKNKEYLDQVYYALGDISYRENDIPSALAYFKLSAQSSMANTRQKGVSYLHIADIYFDRKEYKPAQSYYDSTMAFLPKDYKNYEQIKNKKESLTAMIKNISIISREDSLLKVSAMDTAQIGKLIDGIIAKLIEEEEKKKQEQEAKGNTSNSTSLTNDNNPWQSGNSSGTWYFYNTNTVSFGFAEFFKKWGNRTLEDNWRRSSKETIMAEEQVDTAKEDTAVKGKIADNKTQAYYIKNIPFDEDQKVKSRLKIIDAYYILGGIYKEDLQNNPKSAETFEELLKRYPDNKYTLNLYYQLYRIYLAENNQGRANYYKDKILNEHPDSEYAKIIRNPDYQKALLASKNEIEKFYGETFYAYHQAQYGEVIAMVNKADSFYSSSDLMPKFALLRAYSIGRTHGEDDYEKALQGVIAKYPKDDAKAKAQELLDYMKKLKEAPVDSAALKDTIKYMSPYTFKDSSEHQCIIIISAKKINISDFEIRISNFNSEYFRLSDLSTSHALMDMEHQIVSVKTFSTAGKAKDYFDLINQDSKVFKDISPEDYQIFPISSDNYVVFYQLKNINEYRKFFSDNYYKKEK
ncbi:MAG: tetratricopeptide repeat protein [Bacteroidetes bacterium]|nr:tetratricopeptide repeat protein [Bacteroidota bacterium]